MTKKLTNIKRKDRIEEVYITYPIVEAKRESKTASFQDPEKFLSVFTDSLVNKSLHGLLDTKQFHFYYAIHDSVEHKKMKTVVDSVQAQLKVTKYKTFKIKQNLQISSDQKFILIPYYAWTRSTPDYYSGQCGAYGSTRYCNWTGSEGDLLMINKETKEVNYFRHCGWQMATILDPDQSRVTRQLRRITKPLVRKLKRFKAK